MRAAVLVDANHIEVRDVPFVPPRAHDVVVRVAAVGLCGTDLHIVAGHANYNRDPAGRLIPLSEEPQILGHEIAGIIEDVGADVRDLRPGDHVVVDQGRNCWSERRDPLCDYCATGDSHQCEWYREHGITGLPGGFATHLTLPAVNAVRVDRSVDLAEAALTEPLGCVLHSTSMLRRAPARFPLASARTILIFGAGPAGLLFVQMLRNVLGFDGRIVVSDPVEKKRALAARFGAEAVAPEAIEGNRAEIVIDASGAAAVFSAIPAVLRKQGTVLLYGHGHAGADLSVLNAVQFLEPALVSPAGASGGFDADGRPTTYVKALELIASRTIDVASLISHRYEGIDAVPRAFAGDHRRPDYVKGVITL